LRYIELFAGIGGFRYGLEKANDTVTERTQQGIQQGSKSNNTTIKPFLGTKQFTCDRNILQNKTSEDIQKTMSCIKEGQTRFTCVYANEWDKYACQIYRKNFGDKELHKGDITKIAAESIPDHDFLIGGFPCPTYSIAGKRKGFDDPQGLVFFDICRIAKVKKPRLLLLENVKGLLNHDGGNTFRIILYSLSELGYDCEWEVLNSKNFGVPQNRERVFIVGHLRGTGRQKVFPIGEGVEIDLYENRNKLSKQYTNTLRTNYSNGFANETYIEDIEIRRLTPTECERLQGFPDGWTEGVSDSQRYKCLGNAVTMNVVEEIGRKILKVIK